MKCMKYGIMRGAARLKSVVKRVNWAAAGSSGLVKWGIYVQQINRISGVNEMKCHLSENRC